MNPIVFFVAALVPLVLGFVWYHPRLFGTAWGKGVGLPAEVLAKSPKPVVFIVSYLLSLMLAFVLFSLTVHQNAVVSLFVSLDGFGDPSSPAQQQLDGLLAQFAGAHRSFGHGALHGAITALFVGVPVLVTNGMFERRSWKLNLINAGYWLVTVTLMGGLVCQFA